MKPGAVRNVLLIALIALVGLASSADARRRTFTFTADTVFTVTGSVQLDVDNEVGDITILPGTSSEIKVHRFARIVAKDSAQAEDYLSDIDVHYEHDRNTLSIETDVPRRARDFSVFDGMMWGSGRNRFAIDFEIEVPENCDVSIHTTSGDIDLAGLKGHFDLDATSGDMAIDDIEGRLDIGATSGDIRLVGAKADVTIDVSSGDVIARRIEGDLDIRATSGDILVDDLNGNLSAHSSSGDQELTDITGSVAAHASSGNIECYASGGDVDIEASSGDAHVITRLTENGRCTISTTSGDVTLGLAESPGAQLEIETRSGETDDRIGVDWRRRSSKHRIGTYGDGNADVQIVTGSGDVRLKGTR